MGTKVKKNRSKPLSCHVFWDDPATMPGYSEVEKESGGQKPGKAEGAVTALDREREEGR
jgi:hypothetical protein